MDEAISVGSHSDPFVDELTRDRVGKAIGMKDYAEVKKNQDQIKRLIDWAQAKGAKDVTDIVWSIKQLASRTGSPSLGQNWAQHLAQYAYLEMERMKIDGQLKEMTPEIKGKEEDGNKEANTTSI